MHVGGISGQMECHQSLNKMHDLQKFSPVFADSPVSADNLCGRIKIGIA